jgi:hypothetical protein
MGTRCWSGGGREALVCPKQIRGRKHTLACRQISWRESRKDRISARGKAREAVRQNEMVRGTGESRRKHHLPRASERSPSVTNGGRRASARLKSSDALSGALVCLNDQGSQLTIAATALRR